MRVLIGDLSLDSELNSSSIRANCVSNCWSIDAEAGLHAAAAGRDRRIGDAPRPSPSPAISSTSTCTCVRSAWWSAGLQVDAHLRTAGGQFQGLAHQGQRDLGLPVSSRRMTRWAMAAATWTALASQCAATPAWRGGSRATACRSAGRSVASCLLDRLLRRLHRCRPAACRPSCSARLRIAAASCWASATILRGLGADLVQVRAWPGRPCRRS